MQRATTIAGVREVLKPLRAAGKRIGFVPTMGYLHAGHMSLVERCVAENDVSVASIFVNPAQFGPNMDLDRYPRDPEGDGAKLAAAGVDLCFEPAVEEIYPEGFGTWVEVDKVTEGMDGASRPGYFRGICTVVLKLFEIVRPDAAYFGEKDLQQAVTVRRMIEDLHLEIDLSVLPTVREPDGLAMSSRNAYLNDEDRAVAPLLHEALTGAAARFREGERSADALVAHVREVLARAPAIAVDYISVVDLRDMQPVESIDGDACIALAVDLHGTRLIDNIILRDG